MGLLGLTAAHELVQRGFLVQVVEREASQDVEYACEVGGLARSQPKRIRCTRRPHWELYNKQSREEYVAANPALRSIEDEGVAEGTLSEGAREANLATIRAIRDRPMQPVQKRYPISQRISLLVRKEDGHPVKTKKQQAEAKVSDGGLLAADELLAIYGINDSDAWAQIEDIPDWHGEIKARIGQAGPNYLNRHKLEAVCCSCSTRRSNIASTCATTSTRCAKRTGAPMISTCASRDAKHCSLRCMDAVTSSKAGRKNVAAACAWAHVIENKIVSCIAAPERSDNEALKARVAELKNDSDVRDILSDTIGNFKDHLICRGSAPRPEAASDGVMDRRLRTNVVECQRH